MTFWSCKKNGLTKKRLISKFMMPQPGKQLQYTLPNISRSKGNQAMKFGQVIEYNKRNIFLQKSRISFNIFRHSSTRHRIKTKCI